MSQLPWDTNTIDLLTCTLILRATDSQIDQNLGANRLHKMIIDRRSSMYLITQFISALSTGNKYDRRHKPIMPKTVQSAGLGKFYKRRASHDNMDLIGGENNSNENKDNQK